MSLVWIALLQVIVVHAAVYKVSGNLLNECDIHHLRPELMYIIQKESI